MRATLQSTTALDRYPHLPTRTVLVYASRTASVVVDMRTRTKVIWLCILAAFALVASALTGIGALPKNAGWGAASIAAAVGLAPVIFGIISEWFKKLVGSDADNRILISQSLGSGDIVELPLNEADFVAHLRVHPSIELPGTEDLPPYVPRQIDATLGDLLKAGGLIIVEGNSASGKTRSLAEAAIRVGSGGRWRSIVVPRDGANLRRLAAAGFDFGRKLVWLDDIERFVSPQGLDDALLNAMLRSWPGVVFAATLRSREKLLITHADDVTGFSEQASRLFAAAKTVRLDRNLKPVESAGAYKLRHDARIAFALDAAADGVGLAEHLAAGPAAVDRYMTAKDGGNELAAALISAAIDIRRAGYLNRIPIQWLYDCAPAYLDQRSHLDATADDLGEALVWATEPVHGASACLIQAAEATYVPFDYLMDHVERLPDDESYDHVLATRQAIQGIRDDVWHYLMENVPLDDPQYLSCLSAGFVAGHPGMLYCLGEAIKHGVVGLADFNDGDKQLALAQTCVRLRMCVGCMLSMIGLDITPLAKAIELRLEPYFFRAAVELTSHTYDALLIADTLGEDGGFITEGDGSDIWRGLEAIPPAHLREIGLLLAEEGTPAASHSWLDLAARHGDQIAQAIIADGPGRPPRP